MNCVVSLEKNEYKGNTSLSVRLRDISYSDTDREALLRQMRTFEGILRGEECPPSAEALAPRDRLAGLYNLLRGCTQWCGTPEQLLHSVSGLTCLQLLVALEIWRQCGLVSWRDLGERIAISVLPTSGKVDMTATPLWQYLTKGDVENVK